MIHNPFDARRLPRAASATTKETPVSSVAATATAAAKSVNKSAPAAASPPKLFTDKAAALCDHLPLTEQAAVHLNNELAIKGFVDLLVEMNLYADATRVLAFMLPKRDAVRWACLCLREALGANPAPKIKLSLEAAEKWVKQPTEENRRDGMKAAEAAGFSTPAAITALAAFWSGGSLTPPGAPVVPPAEHMTAEAVAGAILLTAVGAALEEVAKRHQRFLALGLGVAAGHS